MIEAIASGHTQRIRNPHKAAPGNQSPVRQQLRESLIDPPHVTDKHSRQQPTNSAGQSRSRRLP